MAYEDLLVDSSQSFEDNNYFILTVEELEPGRIYPLQFKWKYKDGSYGKDWSATYNITTQSEQVPGAPGVTADGNTPGMITITWDGENVQGANIESQIKQVDIYISGSPFDGSKPALNFDKAGTKTVTAPAGVYTIVAYAITARGTVSTQTTIANVTVTGLEPPVDPPTLPSGLSVASAPFAVSVNWSGTYSSSSFDGFKSVDIHVRGSDVGSTATSGFSTTTQVATLTVTGTTNRQNIGLDNLRQALSLANNQAAYTSPMFFYYIARNTNDALYSVGGVPTYTRINSASVNPTQANFIDLASGVISIENLVAGNGQFASWLRAGSAGGTRIELSAVNDFTNGGNTVQKGLVAYSSGSTEIFNLDIDTGTLTINGSGTFTGDLTAGSGNSIFKSDSNGIYLGNAVFASAPFSVSRSGVIKAESGTIGGLTLASNAISNSSNTFKIGSTGQLLLGSESAGQNNLLLTPTQIVHRTGSTSTGIFTLDIATGTLSLSGYASTAALNGKSKTYYQASQPASGMIQGDIWIDSDDSYKVYTYTGSAWQLSQDSAAAQTTANTAANRAQKFDLVGNVDLGISLNNTGSIYSNKSTYGSGTTGWFLGYRDLGGGTYTPALDVGGTTSYVRWTGSELQVKGNITADSGSIAGWTINTSDITSSSGGTVLYNNGKITIGTTGDDSLKLNSGANIAMFAAPGNASIINFYTTTSPTLADSRIQQTSGGDLQIRGYIGGTYRTALTAYTYVVQGALAQSYNNGTTTSTLIVRRDNGTASDLTTDVGTTTRMIQFQKSYADGGDYRGVGGISASNTTTNPVFFIGSDERLKKNIEVFNDTTIIEDIKKINTYKFHDLSVSDDSEKTIGFMAKEFYPKYSDIVIGKPDEIDEDGDPVYMQIHRENLIPHLFNAIKYLIDKVEDLEERLNNV